MNSHLGQIDNPRDRAIFSRRTWLRGLGVSMALPWMESLRVWGQEAAPGTNEPPVRLAILFSGNGYHGGEWWAKENNGALELGRVLAPLNEFRDSTLFIKGLYNAEASRETFTVLRLETYSPVRRLPLAGISDPGPVLTKSLRRPWGEIRRFPVWS